ncbi:MAG: BA14K family protein [Nitratireductor sp.]
MPRTFPLLAWCAALVVGALAMGTSSASAGERLWRHEGGLSAIGCAGGSTDCPTIINRGGGVYFDRRLKRRHVYRDRDFRDHRIYKRRYKHRHKRRIYRHGGPRIYLNVPGLLYDGYAPRRYVQPRRRYDRSYGLSGAHIQWCFDRYRSYRVRDNTFQPYHGRRRQCVSPYS